MRRKARCLVHLILCLMLLALSLPGILTAAPEQRTALVIGNSAYSSGSLKNPATDATAMAAMLMELGFTVTLKKNANQQEMDESIREFGRQLKRTRGVGLFFYAGHGIQFGGVNYLLPVSARIEKESDVRFQSVSADHVLAEMENAENGLNIVILDACRDNPYSRNFRNAARGLAIVSNAPSGTFISYSTGANQVARDGEGKNSPYTRALLENIAKPGLTINKVFMNVRSEVKKETGQIPWELSSLEGDFYFVPGSPEKSAATVPSGKATVKKEESSVPTTAATDDFDDENRKLEAEQRRLEEERTSFTKKKALEEKRQKIAVERERLAAEQEEARQAEVRRLEKEKTDLAKKKILEEKERKIAGEKERLAAEQEAARQAEAEKEKPQKDMTLAMGARPSVSTANEIKRDGRFIAYDNGTVLDTQTNLMWAAKDNGSDIHWASAKSYSEKYRGGGYTDWRMPTKNELAGLYDSSKSYRSDCGYNVNLTELIRLTCPVVQASDTSAPGSSSFFAFGFGGSGTTSSHSAGINYRALPVRSVK